MRNKNNGENQTELFTISKLEVLVFAAKIVIKCSIKFIQTRFILNKHLNSSLSRKTKNKTLIYALVVPEVVGFPYAQISNVKIDKQKKESIYLNAGLIPLIDALSDSFEKSSNNKNDLTNAFEETLNDSSTDPIISSIRSVIIRLKELSTNPEVMESSINTSFEAQIKSLNQLESISTEELVELLSDKGGTAFLQYATTINTSIPQVEQEAIFQSGYLLQLINDFVDIQKDIENGVKTLATRLDTKEYVELVNKEWGETIRLVNLTNGPQGHKDKFLSNIRRFAQLQIMLKAS